MNDLINIIDAPLKNTNGDRLNTRKYVEGLAEYLSKSAMPTTVAIQGQWGSGKTSFMNQLRGILCEDKINGNDREPLYYGIWINMWEYSIMQSPEQTLIGVIKGMTNECTRIIEKNSKSTINQEALLNKAGSLVSSTVKFLATTFFRIGAEKIGANPDTILEDFRNNFQNDDGNAIKYAFDEVRPKEFRDAFADVIEACLSTSNNRRRGFMFFIDDLDRINPENAVQILELLKNMFEVNNCIFVLAIDYDVVVKGLKAKFGSNTGDDDRAFRSFFDKIIQMPFSMPVGAYDITAFLRDSLTSIGYLGASQLDREITLKQDRKKTRLQILDVIDEMTRLSTGSNPRSIKRLLNTLSLIRIISNIRDDENDENMDEYDLLMNYGLVCLQIAYPQIYDRITQEPYYPDWDDATARQFRLKPLTREKLDILEKIEEFDEMWEQVVYQICQTSTYLMASALNISKLLNLIKSLYEPNVFGVKINKMLGMTSVTSVTQSEILDAKKTRGSRETSQKRFEYWEAFQNYAFSDRNSIFSENFNKRKSSFNQWMDFSIGSTSCHITVSQIIKRDELDVELYINDDKNLFQKLYNRREKIQNETGLEFKWMKLDERKASRIIAVKENVKLGDSSKWQEQFEWLMDTMLRMKKTFTGEINS